MQRDVVVQTADPYRQRVLRGLVDKGIVEHKAHSSIYTLVPAWQTINLDQEEAKPEPVIERPPLPDPPKKGFVRPPTIYSNRSREELIDQILNDRSYGTKS